MSLVNKSVLLKSVVLFTSTSLSFISILSPKHVGIATGTPKSIQVIHHILQHAEWLLDS